MLGLQKRGDPSCVSCGFGQVSIAHTVLSPRVSQQATLYQRTHRIMVETPAHSQTVCLAVTGAGRGKSKGCANGGGQASACSSVTLPHWISTEKIIWFHIKIIWGSPLSAPQWRRCERLNGSFDQPSASPPRNNSESLCTSSYTD